MWPLKERRQCGLLTFHSFSWLSVDLKTKRGKSWWIKATVDACRQDCFNLLWTLAYSIQVKTDFIFILLNRANHTSRRRNRTNDYSVKGDDYWWVSTNDHMAKYTALCSKQQVLVFFHTRSSIWSRWGRARVALSHCLMVSKVRHIQTSRQTNQHSQIVRVLKEKNWKPFRSTGSQHLVLSTGQ